MVDRAKGEGGGGGVGVQTPFSIRSDGFVTPSLDAPNPPSPPPL